MPTVGAAVAHALFCRPRLRVTSAASGRRPTTPTRRWGVSRYRFGDCPRRSQAPKARAEIWMDSLAGWSCSGKRRRRSGDHHRRPRKTGRQFPCHRCPCRRRRPGPSRGHRWLQQRHRCRRRRRTTTTTTTPKTLTTRTCRKQSRFPSVPRRHPRHHLPLAAKALEWPLRRWQ